MKLAVTQRSRIVRWYQVAAQVIGWATIGIGLVCWWLDFSTLRNLLSDAVSMKANAAVAFVLIGVSLVACLRGWPKLVALTTAAGCFIFGAVTSAQYALDAGVTLFDSLLGSHPGEVLTPTAGRPALGATICFTLVGISLVLLAAGRWPDVRQGLAAVVAVAASVILFAYLFDNADLATLGDRFTAMPVDSAILFGLCAAALVMAAPDVGWARVIASPLAGGRLFRTLVLPLLVLVFVMAYVADYLAAHAFGGPARLGLALSELVYPTLTIALIGLLFTASIRSDRIDQQRQQLATNLAEQRARLAESQAHYQMLAENATDVVWQVDADTVLQWVTPSVESVLGWVPEQLLGKAAIDLVHPDDAGTLAAWRAAVFDGTPASGFELRLLTGNGDYRWMSLQARPITDGDGTINGAVVGLHDIHEQVLAQQERARSERRYRWLAENASDVVFHIGADSLIRWASPSVARVLGWT
ncbi:MAG: PAS domain-containing protein, partial [Actinomycetes bacterium]